MTRGGERKPRLVAQNVQRTPSPPSRCGQDRKREGKVRDICRKSVAHEDKHWDPDTGERWI